MKNSIKELEQLLKIQRSLTRIGLNKNTELENRITDLTKPAQPMVLPNNFGKAFMGYVECFGGNLLAVYCKDTILSVLQKKDKMSYEDAMEYFNYNIAGSWVGNGTPLYLERCSMDAFMDIVEQ